MVHLIIFEGNILLKNHIPKEKFTKFCNFKKDLLSPFTESQIFIFHIVESIEYWFVFIYSDSTPSKN